MQNVSTHALTVIRLIQRSTVLIEGAKRRKNDLARAQFTSPLVHAMHSSASSLFMFF